ncbi:MAG: DUF4097 domain-containing protein [Defluviitaleaceae bacterium]|nr:DUF4097 domain-containing protein [Defluviitaleaceae bacterium]
MDDRRFNNDGTPVGAHVEQNVAQDIQQDIQQEAHFAYGATPPCSGRRKIRWIPLALVLIVMGGLMFGGAWLSGARGGGIYWENGRFRVSAANRRGDNRTEVTLPANAANALTLSLNIRSANLTIVPTNGNMALVVYGDVDHTVRYANGTLSIETPAHQTRGIQIFGGSFNRREVRLYLPHNTNVQVIDARTTSGNITIEDFAGRELTLQTNSGNIRVSDIDVILANMQVHSGNITVNNMTSNTLSTNGNSGNVRINDSDISGITISMSSGNAVINGGTFTHLQTDSNSGNITVDAAARQDGSVRVEARSGTIRLTLHGADAPLRGIRDNHELRAHSGNINLNGQRIRGNSNATSATANFYVQVRTTSGNIHVNYR